MFSIWKTWSKITSPTDDVNNPDDSFINWVRSQTDTVLTGKARFRKIVCLTRILFAFDDSLIIEVWHSPFRYHWFRWVCPLAVNSGLNSTSVGRRYLTFPSTSGSTIRSSVYNACRGTRLFRAWDYWYCIHGTNFRHRLRRWWRESMTQAEFVIVCVCKFAGTG
jgi:hypothetical protein